MKRKQLNVLAYKYCKNAIIITTTSLITIILHLLVGIVHIYLVLTFGCHNSLSIDFSLVEGPNGPSPLTALTRGHIADYNAPVLSPEMF